MAYCPGIPGYGEDRTSLHIQLGTSEVRHEKKFTCQAAHTHSVDVVDSVTHKVMVERGFINLIEETFTSPSLHATMKICQMSRNTAWTS